MPPNPASDESQGCVEGLSRLARPLLPESVTPRASTLPWTGLPAMNTMADPMDCYDRVEEIVNRDPEEDELGPDDDEDCFMEPPEFDSFSAFRNRLRRPLYAPDNSFTSPTSAPPPSPTSSPTPTWDRFSLPLTEVAVRQFRALPTADAAPEDGGPAGLGRLDPDRAFSIARKVCVTSPSLVLALIYLDRMRKSNPKYLATVSSTDIFLVSLMVSSKFLHDDGEDDEVFNEDWAEAGQITTPDINKLEIDFLCALDWSLLVSPSEFDGMTERLEAAVARNEVNKRGGWTTYSDLSVIIDHMELMKMWRTLVECTWKITALCAATYAAQLMTLLGTVYVLNKTPLGPENVAQLLQTTSPQPSSNSSSNLLATDLLDQAETNDGPNRTSTFLPFSADDLDNNNGHPALGHAFGNHHETGRGDDLLRLRHAPSQVLLSRRLDTQLPMPDLLRKFLDQYGYGDPGEEERKVCTAEAELNNRGWGSLWSNSMIMV